MSAQAAIGQANSLFSLSGDWEGDGKIAARAETELEPGRCKLHIASEPATLRSDVTGKCAVAGGAARLSMRFEQGPNKTIRAGIWSEATEQIVQFRGEFGPDETRLNADTPIPVDGQFYDAEILITIETPETFSLRQSLRVHGEEQWHPVIELSFEREGD